MAINDKPCGGCVHFDQQYIQSARGTRRKVYGFCVEHSVYPAGDATGQIEGKVVPPEAKRAPRGAGADLKIVYEGTCEPNCMRYLARSDA